MPTPSGPHPPAEPPVPTKPALPDEPPLPAEPALPADLLLAAADTLLELLSDPGPPLAVGIRRDTSGQVLLNVATIPPGDVATSLTGLVAPADWQAFGVACAAEARSLDDGAPLHDEPWASRLVHLVDRSGRSATILARPGDAPVDSRVQVEPMQGRVADACLRVLGLPTAPPAHDTNDLWAACWLDAALARTVGSATPPSSWEELALLHPAHRSAVAVDHPSLSQAGRIVELGDAMAAAMPWEHLRLRCRAGALQLGDIGAEEASWCDEGSFARRVMERQLPHDEVLAALGDLLAPNLHDRIRSALDAWGLLARTGADR